jgi:exosortase A-associated hydrolase 2
LTALVPEPFFLALRGGQRFCLLHRPRNSQSRGVILYLHPFAEEMNKCRRMAAVGARSLAEAGWNVLQMDLSGCGDSDGDFGEATWEAWLADAVSGCEWLASNVGTVSWIWGLRAGALLAVQCARQLEVQCDLLVWQPVLSGSQHLTQFLRLKGAGQMLGGGGERAGTQSLRERLRAGTTLEIAGYRLSPGVAEGLENATLDLARFEGRVVWCEVAAGESPALGPGARVKIDQWRDAGVKLETVAVNGPNFWQTVEISECPQLVEATVRALS